MSTRFFFLRNNLQSKPTAIPAWSNKCTSNPKPKWSPQTKTPRSKPKDGTKGVTSLTYSFGMKACHHHTRKYRSEKNRKDKTKLKDRQSEGAWCRKEEIMNDLKMKQTNNDIMDSQYSSIQIINAKRTRGGPQPRWEKVCKAKWTNRL